MSENRAETDQAALSALAWQVELGADEAIAEAPINRFEESAQKPAPAQAATRPAPEAPRAAGAATTAVPDARHGPSEATAMGDTATLAAGAQTLDELARIVEAWDGTPLKAGARNFVFSDGTPGAKLMVIGEAPGAEEDRQGKPFVGTAGRLLDRMLAAIGRDRNDADPARSVYITNMVTWRPTGNRTPTDTESEAFRPFLERHIQLADPDIVISMGNTPTKGLLRTTTGIKRMRGTWVRHQASGKPLLPTFHPAYLLRQPGDKRLAWLDLIAAAKALEGQDPL